MVRSARPTAPSPTARRSSTTRSRRSPTSIPRSSVPCAGRQRMPRTTASSSSSTAAGVPRRTRNSSSARRSRSTARKRKPPAGWPRPTRRLTCRGTRSTSGPPTPRRGCPSTAPRYGLCQIYGNEPWHYELRPDAVDHGCPRHVRRPHARSEDAAVTGVSGSPSTAASRTRRTLFHELGAAVRGRAHDHERRGVGGQRHRGARQPMRQRGTQVRDLRVDAARVAGRRRGARLHPEHRREPHRPATPPRAWASRSRTWRTHRTASPTTR